MAMKRNIIQEKSFRFSIRIINCYKYLKDVQQEYVISKQILRSGTSIGANVEEAIGGQSEKDFINKISIAYKESRETNYWLRLLKETNFIDAEMFTSINNDCEEIIKIITSIQKTTKSKIINKIKN